MQGIALCHNVTPVVETDVTTSTAITTDVASLDDVSNADITYQASSPDEVALVAWTEQVGLTLVKRDLNSMTLRTPQGQLINYNILQIFPFTSESKRMGIIVKVRNHK